MLARKLRAVLAGFDFSGLSRESVAEVLEKEAISVEYGSVDDHYWLSGLEDG